MENHRETTNTDESPPEFEFGSLTPSSPSQDSYTENSPADHLFLNGRLLPHTFPAASNSTNSRSSFGSISSSSSYSPRTSNCNGNNNKSPINLKTTLDMKSPINRCGRTVNTENKRSPQYKRRKATEIVTASLYRSYSSQRWQYITPAPVKMSRGIRVGRKNKAARVSQNTEERRGSKVMKLWRRFIMAAIFACRECHALEGA